MPSVDAAFRKAYEILDHFLPTYSKEAKALASIVLIAEIKHKVPYLCIRTHIRTSNSRRDNKADL